MLTQRAADLAVLIKAQRKALSYTQVFPTLVGVFPNQARCLAPCRSLPHARGGE